MDKHSLAYLGHGIYSVSEVSSLTGISASSISRWIKGYSHLKGDFRKIHPPVFNSDYKEISGKFALSFLDLIEVLFVEAFVHRGVSLRTVRIAVTAAAKLYGFSHPFAKQSFMTDGKTILMQIAHDTDDKELINMVSKQYEINDIVEPILRGDLEFGDLDIASRWWPMGRNNAVVLDPSRNFGQPVVDKVNIPTATLFRTYNTVKSVQDVADWFEIDPEYVASAIQYENMRSAA